MRYKWCWSAILLSLIASSCQVNEAEPQRESIAELKPDPKLFFSPIENALLKRTAAEGVSAEGLPSVSLLRVVRNPEPYLNKRIEILCFYVNHRPDGPWLVADPNKNGIEADMSITFAPGSKFVGIDPESGREWTGFPSNWVLAVGMLKRGRYYNAPWREYLDNKLYFELETVTRIEDPTVVVQD